MLRKEGFSFNCLWILSITLSCALGIEVFDKIMSSSFPSSSQLSGGVGSKRKHSPGPGNVEGARKLQKGVAGTPGEASALSVESMQEPSTVDSTPSLDARWTEKDQVHRTFP